MKITFPFLFCFAVITIMNSCKNHARYLDLSTNQYVSLKKDSTTGYMMNSKTGEPIDVYVDTRIHDTVYGPTGEIVNGEIHKTNDGRWIVKMNGEEYKAKSESDNSAKVK